MRIVFMGSPGFAVPSLEQLVSNGFDVVAVYTQPDRPAGRGREVYSPPVKQTALESGLTVIQPEKLRDPEVVEGLKQFQPEAIVVAAYGQILPEAVLEIPRYGCINIHPSLLPRYRGSSPVTAAILAGDEFTGVTIMQMDAGLDTGPLLVQAQVPVAGYDTTETLSDKLSLVAAGLLQDVLWRRVHGEPKPRPQDAAAATYIRQVEKADGEIDWNQPAVRIWRQVRAYQPWPGSFTYWQEKRLAILRSVPLPWPERLEPGLVIDLAGVTAEASFGVATGEGVLGVRAVKLEGKRETPAEDFLRGQRNFIGAKLPC